ncbi:hypothetical protein DPQ33_11825 [Oceanidesulfovibrio indonesiensis]|uniref:Magnesium transporter MgtE intracellular domain-containing protein n=1 Tax=Oceanidesulfovibrio indonesiensis TaxID=54767 RepID=A0A7M3MDJ2_9BACT|nr:hypothetical protein [Oceanidesulfovibrio indonesiensis]TVM16675.1 hypothetical protein DPQ33_11825 [Oceanidesulfovibrio indonesiensis]
MTLILLTVFIKVMVMAAMVVDAPLLNLDGAVRYAALIAQGEPAMCEEVPLNQGVSGQQYVKGCITRDSLFVSYAYAASPAYAQEAPTTDSAPAQPADSPDRQALREQQAALEQKELELKQLEQELNAKLTRMQELEAKLTRMLEQANEVSDQKMRHLIDVYSNMKAKQAAQVLETLDEGIAVKILAGMRGRQAGEILTFVEAKKAARLSEKLTRMQVPFQ